MPRSPSATRRHIVLFVGGTEAQARYVSTIERALAARHGASVRVEWFLTGWTANWLNDAKRVEARLPNASVMVIMSFVRTLLGRRLRRAAGRAGVPWVACTGHGRSAIEDAIDRALSLADRARRCDRADAAADAGATAEADVKTEAGVEAAADADVASGEPQVRRG